MSEIIQIPLKNIKPERKEVFATQGILPNSSPPEKVLSILNNAMEIFLESSYPKGIIANISISEFDIIYKGEGMNEQETPLDTIFRKADNLAVFAVTIGEKVSQRINELFNANEFALGSMLDSVASAGTDKAADSIEEYFSSILSLKGLIKPSTGILRYSPGYCGWHISGQKKLFEFLHPEAIGITLLDSYLMKPLKSISGIIVAGNKKIHIFKDSYPFCAQCKTRSCRKRIRTLFRKSKLKR